MKNNKHTQTILHTLETNPKATTRDIAFITQLRKHAVRHILQTLEQEKQIRRIPLIDVYPLGYQHYGCYFSIAAQQQENKTAFISALTASHHTVSLAEVGGDFHYTVVIIAKNPRDVIHFFHEYTEKFGEIFLALTITTRIFYTQFNHKYLSSPENLYEATIGNVSHTEMLDGIDHHILLTLTKNQLSLSDLAKELKTPLSTIKYRIQKLEEKNIISGYVYDINLTDLPMQKYALLIQVNEINAKIGTDLCLFSQKHPNICHFLQCIGPWNFEIGTEVSHPEDITAITQSLYKQFGTKITSIKTVSVHKTLKLSYYPF